MPHVKNILVPVDTHENAGPVVQWASLLAHKFGSRLVLLHVNESLEFLNSRPGMHGGGFPGLDLTINKWRQHYSEETKAALDQLTNQYCTDESVSFLMLEGRAPAVITSAVESTKSDVIVMGTHGRPWYQRAFLGSTAESVLRTSTVPVLIVHNSAPPLPLPRLHRVLFPTDFSLASQAGKEWVQYLAQHGTQEVILLHAIENPLLDTYTPDTSDFNLRKIGEESRQHLPRSAQPYWEHAAQVARVKLQHIRQELLTGPSSVALGEGIIEEGPAANVILKTATQFQAEVIVMATHGRTGVRRFVLGSVTEKILRSAPCPVLAVPSKQA